MITLPLSAELTADAIEDNRYWLMNNGMDRLTAFKLSLWLADYLATQPKDADEIADDLLVEAIENSLPKKKK